MSTFTRYFITHLILVIGLGMILFVVVESRPTILKMLLYIGIVIVFYVLPMSLFYSHQGALGIVEADGTIEEIKAQLDTICNKANRELVLDSKNEYIYSYKSSSISIVTRFDRWLTNDIAIKKTEDNRITIEAPKYLLRTIENCLAIGS